MKPAEFYYCDDLTDRELTLMFQSFCNCEEDELDTLVSEASCDFQEFLRIRFPKFKFQHLKYYKLRIDGELVYGIHAHRGWMVKLDLTKVHPLYRMDFYPRCFDTKEEAEKELKYIRENALFTSYHHIPPEAYVVEDF